MDAESVDILKIRRQNYDFSQNTPTSDIGPMRMKMKIKTYISDALACIPALCLPICRANRAQCTKLIISR